MKILVFLICCIGCVAMFSSCSKKQETVIVKQSVNDCGMPQQKEYKTVPFE